MRSRELQLLGGLVALAALLRFATLDQQSYWYDEAVTVGLLEMGLGDMLDRIPETESTPPLYYVVAWLWSKLFGVGEVGLRSLSALCGTAFVPVAYAIGARAVSARVGLVAAALAAVNPLLVWYSQEARAYSLLVLLAGLSFVFFLRLLTGDPRRRTLVLWAVVSALALATHYFAAFLVAIEAVWLLATAANRRPVAIAAAALAAVEVALLPLLLHQRSLALADFIDDVSLGYRFVRTLKQFLVGFDAPGEAISGVAAGLLVLIALWFAWSRGNDRERRTALIGLAIGGTLIAATVVLAVVGVDYFDSRNLLVAWPPLALAVAAGLGAGGAGRAGAAAASALALLCASTVVFVVANESLQRDDWRGVADALHDDDSSHPRAVVVTPSSAPPPFAVYAPELEVIPPDGVRVSEVVVVALPERHRTQARRDDPPRPANPHPPPGFDLADKRYEDTFTLIRYTAPKPTTLTPGELAGARLQARAVGAFLDP